MAETTIGLVSDAYDRACDGCPFRDECRDYQDAFGPEECFRDHWAKALADFLKESKEAENEKN